MECFSTNHVSQEREFPQEKKKVNQLNGVITIQSELNKGTSIIIKLPMKWSEIYENQSNISR